ncbi:MAG: hypothetical protein ACO1NO_09275 [Burkholderiaceae bacterium]
MLERYGHVYLSIVYLHLLDVHDSGFVYQRKAYKYSDVVHVDARQIERIGLGSFSHLILVPRAHIELSDGNSMIIHGHTLIKRNGVLRQGYDSAFSELVALLQEKRSSALREKLEAQSRKRDASSF